MRALFLSPHLDDALFSAGAVAAALVAQGHSVTVATIFTRTVHPATGFALACQRDKGLPDTVDYMALRRAEDALACRRLGARPMWLDFAEAPHRGYANAAALFAGPHHADAIVPALIQALRPVLAEADTVFAPAGIGAHVDHCLLIEAVRALQPACLAWWTDLPYASRAPAALPVAALADLPRVICHTGRPALIRKLDACTAYTSQLGFQFGGRSACRDGLTIQAEQTGDGTPAEAFFCAQGDWLQDLVAPSKPRRAIGTHDISRTLARFKN